MIILGIDPGLAHTGWGIVETRGSLCRARAYGCVTTHSGEPIDLRLGKIFDEVSRAIEAYHPTQLAIEQLFFGENDELLPQAVDVILDTKQASVSMLQRRLKLGYSRAARLVDQMEERGIVGPFEGSKPRQLLITKEQWEAIQGGASMSDFDPNPPVEEEIP